MEKDLGIERQVSQLLNGTPVISYYKKSAPISMDVGFLSGARHEPAQKPGLAHFAEHLVMSGTKSFPTTKDMGKYFDRFGGSHNAYTSVEKLALTYSIADDTDFRHICRMMDECLNHSLYLPETIKKEQGAVLQELNMRDSHPQSAGGWSLWELVFQDTNLARNVLGTNESIQKFTRDDVMEYVSTFLHPDRMTIVLSGGLSADEAAKQIDSLVKLPSSIKRLTQTLDDPLPRIRKSNVTKKIFEGHDNVEVFIGFRTISLNHKDANALYVLRRMLGAPRYGRLYIRLRQVLGLVYSVSTGNVHWSDAGVDYIATSCNKKELKKVVDAISREIVKLQNEPVDKEEIAYIVDRTRKSTKITMQTSGAWVSRYARDEIFGVAKPLDLEMAELQSVRPQDVQRVAAEYYSADNWYISLAGEIEKAEVSLSL